MEPLGLNIPGGAAPTLQPISWDNLRTPNASFKKTVLGGIGVVLSARGRGSGIFKSCRPAKAT